MNYRAYEIWFVGFFVFYFILSSSSCFSQNWIWAKSATTTNTSASNGSNCVAIDAAGNVYVTGYFKGPAITFGSITLTSSGGYDIFIAKYDSAGNVLWARSGGSVSNDQSNSVATDASGNVYITGFFFSPTITFGTTVLNNSGGPTTSDLFLVKYDASGNVIWARNTGGSGDQAYGVGTDLFGNVFITGFFGSQTIAFGSTTLTNVNPLGNLDVFVAKYDASGNVIWAKNAGGINGDIGHTVAADAAGNVYVTGYFDMPSITFGTITLINNGSTSINSEDMFLVKYDPAGNVIWAKSAGGTQPDQGAEAKTDAAGNIFVAGWFTSLNIAFGTTTLTNSAMGNFAFYIAKYDPSGNVLWAKTANGATYDYGSGIATDAVGNAYVTGDFNCPTITFGTTTLAFPAGGINPLFIVKYDPNGNVLCASALPSGGDYKNSVATDAFNNAYITGHFEASPFMVGSTSLNRTGNKEVFVAKYTCCTPLALNASGINVCQGNISTLTVSGGITYSWNNGSTGSIINVAPSATSTYTVTAIDTSGCAGNVTLTVTVFPSPTVNASGNITIVQGETTILTATGGVIYLWSNGETSSEITISPQTTTQYCVTVADTNSCTNSACATVSIESPCDTAGKFFFPNAFSPNGDGENDLLKFYYGNMNCINKFQLFLYDRWGEKVFETDDAGFYWDGKYSSKILDSQVFDYYLNVEFFDGTMLKKKGNISLAK